MPNFLNPSALSRRNLLKVAGAGTLGAIGAASLPSIASAFTGSAPNRPNFLFIMADDLGYADLSCYGRRDYQTPALDALAASGTRFLHGYANSSVCSPTRLSLITGRYHYRLPAGQFEPLGGADVGLDPSHPTLPSLLREQGYHTALVGKWHLGGLPKFGPLQSGYDEFWGNRGGAVDYFEHSTQSGNDLWDGDVAIDQSGYYTDMLADRSVQFLNDRAKQDKPWLLSLHFTAPHWPWTGPNDEEEAKRIDKLTHHDGGTMATYAEMVTSMDAAIGRVLAKLKALGQDKNTVVVFTSDNGGERFSDTWPFTGMKTLLLEGGIRVPLIVRWPGLSVAGSTSDVPVASMDFLPTFLAAAGDAPHPNYPSDGLDWRPALSGAVLPDRPLYWRYGRRSQKALRFGRYKYLSIDGNEFLFDIVADPRERANLKARQPEIFAKLQSDYAKWNATMLFDPNARSYGFSPSDMADHFVAPATES
jgi:arylsulfatase A-like enzyme